MVISIEASPTGIVTNVTPGSDTASSPAPENATPTVSAGSPVASASARAMRNVPGASEPSSAFATAATASAPTWNTVGHVIETTVPLVAVASTAAVYVPAERPETTAE